MSWQRRKASRAFAPAPAENPVVMAISNNDRQHLRCLLDGGANPDAPHRDTCAMVFAARRGELDVIDLLLSHRGNINVRDGAGRTALMTAVMSRQHDLARALMARGADVDMQDKDGLTALLHAALEKDHEAVQLLACAGADAGSRAHNGKSLADYLNLPENTGLKATFDAAQKESGKINTAVTTGVAVRKPLQIRHKQD